MPHTRVPEQEATYVLVRLEAVDDPFASRMGAVHIGPVRSCDIGSVLLYESVAVIASELLDRGVARVVAANDAQAPTFGVGAIQALHVGQLAAGVRSVQLHVLAHPRF